MAEGQKNLCAQIPTPLHMRVRQEQEASGQTLSEYMTWLITTFYCDVTRSVSKMTEIERRGGKRWDKPKKAEKSRDCRGGKF